MKRSESSIFQGTLHHSPGTTKLSSNLAGRAGNAAAICKYTDTTIENYCYTNLLCKIMSLTFESSTSSEVP
jgi:hypothetical protein